jgi:hypothetical protein
MKYCFALITLISLPLLSFSQCNLALSFNTRNICPDTSFAQSTVYVSNGVAPYTYSWSDNNNQTTIVATGLPAGTYTVTVTDGNGCNAIDSTTVVALPSFQAFATVQDVSCYGGNDGRITVDSATTTTVQDLWNTGQVGSIASSLVAGNYTVSITTIYGCEQTFDYTVNSPSEINISYNVIQPSSNSSNDGALNTTISGGVPPYSYSWSTSDMTGDISNVSAGIYTLTVTDANNCTSTLDVNLYVTANENIQNNNIKVFPNPSNNGLVQVEWDLSKTAFEQLIIFDHLGRIIYQEFIPYNQPMRQLDLKHLPSGYYNILLRGPKHIETKRIGVNIK